MCNVFGLRSKLHMDLRECGSEGQIQPEQGGKETTDSQTAGEMELRRKDELCPMLAKGSTERYLQEANRTEIWSPSSDSREKAYAGD